MTAKPSDMPHTKLAAIRTTYQQREDSLQDAIDDTRYLYTVFTREDGHDPLTAAILTHAALTNQIIEE